jgi:hypothetical protein
MYSFSMVIPRGSTCAFGFDEISLGSVVACGATRVCATAVSLTTELITTTITKSAKVRIKPQDWIAEEKLKRKSSREKCTPRTWKH